jgi:hypothetical protein
MLRGVLVCCLAAAGLLTAGCAGEPPADVDLFREYTRSSEVANDKYPTPGARPEDRLATFASRGTPDQLQASLLGATECADDCDAGDATRAAAKDFGAALYERSVLVKHGNGGLELASLYVAKKGDAAVLVDATGATYADLAAFTADNEVFATDDLMFAPEDITAVPGEGKVVTVYAKAPSSPVPWVIGVAVLLGVLGGLVAYRRLARRAPG